ncbi:uncharacterized protein N0V89_012106 [Didymosphaeria variabile]|uniref:Uncharacterized protein n=1 Tax=Didymosphaeria variabile TaxID=1932322 RepID=A0A9W8X8R2_9PLEO|nr:uncharacterized protein N0V89_012106 [Didymosphaeria variabile]KAJ4344366.1 hypothetical protein N0V89_012106 [Didymosphaeria variabile]
MESSVSGTNGLKLILTPRTSVATSFRGLYRLHLFFATGVVKRAADGEAAQQQTGLETYKYADAVIKAPKRIIKSKKVNDFPFLAYELSQLSNQSLVWYTIRSLITSSLTPKGNGSLPARLIARLSSLAFCWALEQWYSQVGVTALQYVYERQNVPVVTKSSGVTHPNLKEFARERQATDFREWAQYYAFNVIGVSS